MFATAENRSRFVGLPHDEKIRIAKQWTAAERIHVLGQLSDEWDSILMPDDIPARGKLPLETFRTLFRLATEVYKDRVKTCFLEDVGSFGKTCLPLAELSQMTSLRSIHLKWNPSFFGRCCNPQICFHKRSFSFPSLEKLIVWSFPWDSEKLRQFANKIVFGGTITKCQCCGLFCLKKENGEIGTIADHASLTKYHVLQLEVPIRWDSLLKACYPSLKQIEFHFTSSSIPVERHYLPCPYEPAIPCRSQIVNGIYKDVIRKTISWEELSGICRENLIHKDEKLSVREILDNFERIMCGEDIGDLCPMFSHGIINFQ